MQQTNYSKKYYPMILISLLIISLFVCSSTPVVIAASADSTSTWYRLRTNHLPFRPAEINLDRQGQLWMTAVEEYDPGVWCLNPDTVEVTYLSNDAKNNYLGSAINFKQKTQLQSDVVYAVKDSRDNIWYALKGKGVLCEKADGQWLSFTKANTDQRLPSDDIQRIRLIEQSNGSVQVLLISYDGLAVIDSSYQLTAVRPREAPYNNYMFNDSLIDSKGQYWIARNNGLEKGDSLFNTSNVNVLFPDNTLVPPLETPITRMMEDSRGNLWFVSDAYGSQGIYCYKTNGSWEHYDLQNIASTRNQVACLTEDSAGNLWFGLNYAGLVRYSPSETGTSWTRYSGESLGLQSESIISITPSNKGIWFVTGYNPSINGNGTGVHYLPINLQGQPQIAEVISYDYRSNSSSLASNRIAAVSADQMGGVWFASYDRSSLARLKADGSWQQFHSGQNGVELGEFGITGIAADSNNNIFIAPQRQQPRAYNAAKEEWVKLPAFPVADIYYYGVYRAPDDSIWYYTADGVYVLNPEHSAWQHINSADGLVNDYVEAVLMDPAGRVWFQTRGGISRLEKAKSGDRWNSFATGDGSGYTGGYRIHIDDLGNTWNQSKQKYNEETGKWDTPTDTSAFDNRTLKFLNGNVPSNMDISQAPLPITEMDKQLMTVDTQGRIYFSVGMATGLSSVNAGVVVYAGKVVSTFPYYSFEKWPKELIVNPNHIFLVKFNKDLDPSTVEKIGSNAVYVRDSNNRLIPVHLTVVKDGLNTITIQADQLYAPGSSYYLYVNAEVVSSSSATGSKKINNTTVMKFTIPSA